ncbi:MAG: class I SAM-dependent methyltransferase [Candidatus Hodarchaeales archaeon]|jgi:2-polyprenyl-3-methyl-5-hydroxy-6-metoxy-1,4-benzoquinol methylase/ribosomal protein S27AE
MEIIDEKKLNKGLSEIKDYYIKIYSKYFDSQGKPLKKYFEDGRCPVCGHGEIVNEFVADRFRHGRCGKCESVYVNPRLKTSLVHDRYFEEEYEFFFKKKIIPSLDYRINIVNKNKYDQIIDYVKEPGNILDMCCGVGDLLSVFKTNGWKTYGLELNPFAAGFAREKFGIDIFEESILEWKRPEEYDVVMMWGALEHFPDPRKVLKIMYDSVKKGGIAVIETTNADSLLLAYVERFGGNVDRIVEGDRHIIHFSLKGLKNIIEDTGFSIMNMKTNGLDISSMNRYCNGNASDEFVRVIQELVDEKELGDLIRVFMKK